MRTATVQRATRMSLPFWAYAALTAILACAGLWAQSSPAAATPASAPDFALESVRATSIPLRDMPSVYFSAPVERNEHQPLTNPFIRRSSANPSQPDAALQSFFSANGAKPTVGLDFLGEGITNGGIGGTVNGQSFVNDPSDSEGAIGANQFVEWINASIAVFDKRTGSLVAGPISGNDLFTALGANNDCATTDDGDPIALYDKAANRWILAQFAVNNGTTSHPFSECVAVSTTPDATGAYFLYQFRYSNFNDYPKIGVWSDKYLATFNDFAASKIPGTPTSFVAGEMCAWDRASMLAGKPANQACTTNANEFGLLPSDIDGSAMPPSSEGGFFLTINDNASLHLYRVTAVNFATGTLSLSPAVTVNVPPFTFPCGLQSNGNGQCIPQNDGGVAELDSLGDRLMYRLAYRNFGSHESLLASHTVDVSGTGKGRTGVRWYEIRNPSGTPNVFQSGTFAPSDGQFRWMSSVAMDHVGDIAAGYSLSSSTEDASVFVATRWPTDADGTLGNETQLVAGNGAACDGCLHKGSDNRWGDYSAMTVDPIDDCTMWYVNQYLRSSVRDVPFKWDTQIASFNMAGCTSNGPVQLKLSDPVNIGAGVEFNVTATVLNNANSAATGYTGTVHFTSSDPQAQLPSDYTFTSADKGSHTFSGLELGTLGPQSVNAADSTIEIMGVGNIDVVPGPVTHFQAVANAILPAGSPITVTLSALDSFNNTATAYNGTVHFVSTDPQATLPPDYTFVPAIDAGTHSFSATLRTAGNISIIARDAANGFIVGIAQVLVTPLAGSSFVVTVPPTGSTLGPFTMLVTAHDPFANIATGYTKTATFAFSGTATATPLSNYTFVSGDHGQHAFSVTPTSTGSLTVTATDSVTASVTGNATLPIVADAMITPSAKTIRIFRMQPQLLVASFSDADPAAMVPDLSVTVDWGDGSALDTGATIQQVGSTGVFHVFGSHNYQSKGSFKVTVTMTDAKGSKAIATSTASFLPLNFSF